MKKNIISLVLFSCFFMNISILCASGDDFVYIPDYSISAPIPSAPEIPADNSGDDNVSYPSCDDLGQEDSFDYVVVNDSDFDCDQSLLSKLKRIFPKIKNLKAVLLKAMKAGIIVGGAVVSYKLAKNAAKKINSVFKKATRLSILLVATYVALTKIIK